MGHEAMWRELCRHVVDIVESHRVLIKVPPVKGSRRERSNRSPPACPGQMSS
jgi:hypothetical protein